MEFAKAVAKDMAGEMLPAPQTMGIILAVAIFAFLFGFLLGQRRGGEGRGC
jgi:hypothetical protein